MEWVKEEIHKLIDNFEDETESKLSRDVNLMLGLLSGNTSYLRNVSSGDIAAIINQAPYLTAELSEIKPIPKLDSLVTVSSKRRRM